MHEFKLIDDIILSSKDNFKCLRGKLHIEAIRKILVDDKPFSGRLKKALRLRRNIPFKNKEKLCRTLYWVDKLPSPRDEDFSTMQIEADKIYWEYTPNNEP